MNYPNSIKGKTKNFPFCPENKQINPDKYNIYMKKIKPKNYTKSKNLLCDWTDEKKYLIHCRMLKFFMRHGMVVAKFHEIVSNKQSRWLEKYFIFNTKKTKQIKNDFEKGFFILLVNAAFGKTLENIRNRLRLKYLEKIIKKIIKQKSKLTFNGTQKSYENYYSYTFKKMK